MRNNDQFAKAILEEIGKEGQKTRRYYQRRSTTNPNLDYYYMLRNTGNTQPVIVEYGFIDNANDITRIKQNYKRYVDAVVRAVLNTFDDAISLPTSSTTYTVKAGDTLWKLARQFNTSVTALKNLNNLSSDSLEIGQILKIPSGEKEDIVTDVTYVVKSGDSLWKIAKQFNTSVAALKDLNQLKTDTLTIGQVLLISSSNKELASPNQTYTVKAGDTLWNLARTFQTTVTDLKTLNNLTSDNLSIGQILKIPTNTGEMEKNYTVKAGDSLWKIANQFGVTVTAIKNLNNLTTNDITPGQILLLP